MVDLNQASSALNASNLQDFTAKLQLIATGILVVVGLMQAIAAFRQARAATEQARTASTQAEAAKAQLDLILSPKLLPARWEQTANGGRLSLINQGQGTAYAIQWKFDKEHNGADSEDAVPNGSTTTIEILNANVEREVIVTYHDKNGEEYTTKLRLAGAQMPFEYREPKAQELIARLRRRQKGSREGRGWL